MLADSVVVCMVEWLALTSYCNIGADVFSLVPMNVCLKMTSSVGGLTNALQSLMDV